MDTQPRLWHNPWAGLYVVAVCFFLGLFWVNLLQGAIIDNYCRLIEEMGTGALVRTPPCCAVLCCAVPCLTGMRCASVCSAVCRLVLCSALLCCAVLCATSLCVPAMLCRAVPGFCCGVLAWLTSAVCLSVLRCAVHAVLCHAVLC